MGHVAPLRPDDPASVGPYRLAGRLGEGGQGVVYLGQARDGAPVAIKVLRDGLGGDDRFAKEIAAARRVEPFCIAQVLDASLGERGGRPYIVTEYVEGPSLHEAGRHAGADLQRLAVATTTALAAIHEAGVVHRDFKPANVLLGPGGPRVIDFGIARAADAAVTATSSVVGTPAYMAPEQLAGHDVGPAADVFAWASVIVFAGTGTPPFGDDTLPAIINRILHNEPHLGDLPEPLRSIVYRCLAKDPAARPAMEEVLLHLIGGTSVRINAFGGTAEHAPFGGTAGPTGPGAATEPTGRRRAAGSRRVRVPWLAGVAVATALAVTAGTAVVWRVSLADQPTTLLLQPGSSVSQREKTKRPKPTGEHTKRDSPTRDKGDERPGGKGDEPTPKTTRATPRPTPTRTTATPTRSATRRPTPAKTATKRPTPTKSAAKTARFTVAYVRTTGQGKIKDEGTCYVGSMNFGAGIDATVPGARFSFQWILDGQVIETGSGKLPDGSRSNYVFSKKQVSLSDGPHTVVYKIVGGGSDSLSFKMCATS